MKKSGGVASRVLGWVRARLLEGYEALIVYRWVRVILGFFAFIGRGVYKMAGKIPDTLEQLKEFELDEHVSTRIDKMGESGFARFKKAVLRLYARYSKGYEAHRMSVKIVITTALAVLSMVLMLLQTNRYTAMMCAGMGFSWLSDAMLMEYPPVRRGVRQYFLWGMGGFACAMALYSAVFIGLFAQTRMEQGNVVLYSCFAVFVVAGLLIWLFSIAFNQKQLLALRLGTLGYGVIVSLMAAAACAVAVSTAGRVWWLAVGGVFFFISDMMIALFNFGSVRVRHPDGWIWLFYAPAQLLLLTGACAAAAL